MTDLSSCRRTTSSMRPSSRIRLVLLRTRYRGRMGDVVRLHEDRKSTRLNSSHLGISYAVFCFKKKKDGSADVVAVEIGEPACCGSAAGMGHAPSLAEYSDPISHTACGCAVVCSAQPTRHRVHR